MHVTLCVISLALSLSIYIYICARYIMCYLSLFISIYTHMYTYTSIIPYTLYAIIIYQAMCHLQVVVYHGISSESCSGPYHPCNMTPMTTLFACLSVWLV